MMSNLLKFKAFKKYYIIIVAAIFLPVVFILNLYVDRKINNFKDEIITKFESITDRKIGYDSISPSIFKYIEIRNFFVADNEGKYNFKFGKFRIGISLRKLLLKDKNPIGLIYLENSIIDIDEYSDKNLIDLFKDIIGIEKQKETPPIRSAENQTTENSTEDIFSYFNDFSITGKNISIIANSSYGNYMLKKLFLNVSSNSERIELSVKSSFNGENTPVVFLKDNFKSDIKIEGTIEKTAKKQDYDVEIKNFKNNLFGFKKYNLNIQYAENKLQIRKTRDRSPFDLSMLYDFNEKKYSSFARFENYSPGKYFTFSSNNLIADLAKSSYSGSIDAVYEPEKEAGKNINYKGNISSSFGSKRITFKNSFSTVFSGNGEAINFEELEFDTEKGSAKYTGIVDIDKMLPEGTLELEKVQINNRIVLNSVAAFSKINKNSVTAEITADINDKKIDNVLLDVIYNDKSYMFNFGIKTKSDGALISRTIVSFADKPSLKSEIDFDRLKLGYIASFILPKSLAESSLLGISNFDLTSKINVETDFNLYSVKSDNVVISDLKNRNYNITSHFNVDKKNVFAGDINVNLKNYRGLGKITVLKNYINKYDINSEFTINNTEYNIYGSSYPDSGLILHGSYNFYFSYFNSSNKENLAVFADNFPLMLPNGLIPKLSLYVSGAAQNNSDMKIMIKNASLSEIKMPQSSGDLSLSAFIDNKSIKISRISFRDYFSVLNGTGDFLIADNADIFGWISLANNTDEEKYIAYINSLPGDFNVIADFYNLPLKRFTGNNSTGGINGKINYKSAANSPQIAFTAALSDGFIDKNKFAFNLDMLFTYQKMLFNNINIEYGRSKINNFDGYFGLESRNYSFSSKLFFQQTDAAQPFEADLIFDGNLVKLDYAKKSFFISPNDFADGNIFLTNIKNSAAETNYWWLYFTNTDEAIDISGGHLDSISAHIEKKGNFNILLKEPFPITGDFSGTVYGNQINANVKDFTMQLGILEKTVAYKYFNPNSGIVRGNFTITGALNDPDFYGELFFEAVKARTILTTYMIGPFDVPATLNGKQFYTPEVLAKIEKSRLLFKFDSVIDRWIPRDFVLDFRVPPKETLYINSVFEGVSVNGLATGFVKVENDPEITRISGKINASKCIVSLVPDEELEENNIETDSSVSGLIVELEITSGSGIEFFWPNLRFPVVRTYVASGQKIDIYSEPDANLFFLTGDVKVVGGEIYYFNQNFFLKEGMVFFNETSEKFDPHVTAKAEIRERSTENKEIKITMIVDNSPMSSINPRFESTPPLSENDIYNLLGEGVYNQLGGENMTLASAVIGSSTYATQLLGLTRPVESRIKNWFNLDLFSIRTQFLQRALFNGLLVNEEQPFFSNSDPGLTYLDNTSVHLGKYFGQYFFFEGLVRINSSDFDTNKYSYYDIPAFMGIYFQTELSLEVDTPLFLIDITLYPQFTNMLGSLLDTTLQLSWRFSY